MPRQDLPASLVNLDLSNAFMACPLKPEVKPSDSSEQAHKSHQHPAWVPGASRWYLKALRTLPSQPCRIMASTVQPQEQTAVTQGISFTVFSRVSIQACLGMLHPLRDGGVGLGIIRCQPLAHGLIAARAKPDDDAVS